MAEEEQVTGADAGGHGLDDLVPSEWPDAVVEALDRWRQGDMMPGAPLFWAAPSGCDPVLDIDAEQDWAALDAGPAADPGWMMVTSQTCDIAAVGPGARHPFVDVSPVYRLGPQYSDQQLQDVVTGKYTHLKALTNPPADDGVYVVDLRMTLPASKGLLVGAAPTAAWATELDRLALAEQIAARLRRPALHDALATELVSALDRYIKTTHKSEPEWWQHVEQVRLRIVGERLAPDAVGLLVCCSVPLTVEQKQVWRNFNKQASRLLRPHGIKVEPQLIQTLDAMPARLYKDSVPLRLVELGRLPSW